MSETSPPIDVAALRKEYSLRGLRRAQLHDDPFAQFEQWFQEAVQAQLLEPNAMSLATANKTGAIKVRTVLLKGLDSRGMVFFTNYTSRKAHDILENPQAALLFPWLSLERQVSISGKVEKISTAESLAYFTSRPVGSQLGAWVSRQSTVIPSRDYLERKLEKTQAKFQNGDIPLPEFWGGFRVVPQTIEFWQGSANRLHDRFIYTKQLDQSWLIDRLSP